MNIINVQLINHFAINFFVDSTDNFIETIGLKSGAGRSGQPNEPAAALLFFRTEREEVSSLESLSSTRYPVNSETDARSARDRQVPSDGYLVYRYFPQTR